MSTTRYFTSCITMGALLLAGCSSRAASPSVAPAMTGHWEGDARVIVAWCRQTNLHVTMDIRADGRVTGKVGDATVLKGRFARNRGSFGRKFNLATDHIIMGELSGPVVAAESITRERVFIPLNFISGDLVGGVHTSGSKFGGKEKMILSASSLTLRHSE